jgi:hypothetical protein
MTAVIEIRGQLATLQAGRWESTDSALTDHLNRYLRLLRPGPYHPSAELYVAERTAEWFRGRLVSHEPIQRDPGVVY